MRGVEGQRWLVVNAQNTVLSVDRDREPVRGNDLQTTIDVDLQEAVETLLEEGIIASRSIRRDDGRTLPSVGGSAVVMDVTDGSVLAMASYPSYDPAEFIGGIDHDYWDFLSDPENHYPLLNRAIQSPFPPGSVFKIVSGAAYMEAGLVGPHTRVSCPGSYRVGGITFRNWNNAHEGQMNLSDALKRSCDTYFYDLAYKQWQREQRRADDDRDTDVNEVLPEIAERFGLGRTLGIDLPSERAGQIPGREWRLEYWERNRDVYCDNAESLQAGSYAQLVNQDLCLYGGQWRGGDAVILEKETGAKYVYVNGRLHPVANYSSAVLIVGARRTVSVARRSLAGVPRGAVLGIPDAPDALPGSRELVGGPWSVCSSVGGSTGASGAAGGPRSVVSASVSETFTPSLTVCDFSCHSSRKRGSSSGTGRGWCAGRWRATGGGSSSPSSAGIPPARCTSSMRWGPLGATLHRQGTLREIRSMSAMVKSTPASCAAASRCSTVLVEPPIAMSRLIAFSNASKRAMLRGSTLSSFSS